MSDRKKLQTELEKILGNNNVYFRPPESTKMHYPAIIYKLTGSRHKYADNIKVFYRTEYELELIEKEADSQFLRPILGLPYCELITTFKSDGLEHYVFKIFW